MLEFDLEINPLDAPGNEGDIFAVCAPNSTMGEEPLASLEEKEDTNQEKLPLAPQQLWTYGYSYLGLIWRPDF